MRALWRSLVTFFNRLPLRNLFDSGVMLLFNFQFNVHNFSD